MNIKTVKSFEVVAAMRALSAWEQGQQAALTAAVALLREYADLRDEDARSARDSGYESLAKDLFADAAALDRAADVLQRG